MQTKTRNRSSGPTMNKGTTKSRHQANPATSSNDNSGDATPFSIELDKTKAGYHFQIRSRNGNSIARSEPYSGHSKAMKSAERLCAATGLAITNDGLDPDRPPARARVMRKSSSHGRGANGGGGKDDAGGAMMKKGGGKSRPRGGYRSTTKSRTR